MENELGLREFLESRGHTYVVTDDKEGPDCEFEKHIPDADIVRAFQTATPGACTPFN